MRCYSNKSRLEEINEIIARSQVRAQQLLAAGSLYAVSNVVTATVTSSAVAPAGSPASGQHQTVALLAVPLERSPTTDSGQ